MVGQRARLKGVTVDQRARHARPDLDDSFGDWQGVPGGQRVALTDRAAHRHLELQFGADRLVGCKQRRMDRSRRRRDARPRRGRGQPRAVEGPAARRPDAADARPIRARRPRRRTRTSRRADEGHAQALREPRVPPAGPGAGRQRGDAGPAGRHHDRAAIEPFGLPTRLVHLVLVNGVFVPPEQRASHTRCATTRTSSAIWPPVAGG